MSNMNYDEFMNWIRTHPNEQNTELLELHCDNKSLTYFTAEIGVCTQLQILDCSDNQLTLLPAEIGLCTQLQSLNCSANYLTFLPAEIGLCTQLQSLNCSANYLTSLPAEIGRCTQLQKIFCCHNQLTSLPAEIGLCAQLQYLDCGYNGLTSLPVEIGCCTQLQKIFCGHNQLVFLPAEIGLCTQLKILSCDENLLTGLPAEIGLCTQLQYLDCGYNYLTSLPAELGLCTQLKTLYCYLNLLKSLPAEIGLCTQLNELLYSNNPMEYIPPNILRILNRNKNIQHIYTDTQSVHNHTIQQGITNGIMYLLAKKPTMTPDELTQQILTQPSLSEQSKRLLLEYMENEEAHSIFNITFKELLLHVISHVSTFEHPTQTNFFEILNTEITDSECKCFTGRLSRLVNSLNGLDEHIQIHISENEQIGNIIIVCKNRLVQQGKEYNVDLHKEMVRSELRLRKFDSDTIETWLEYIV